MPEKPILIFPEKSTTTREKKKMGFGSPSYHFPEFRTQKDRLTPQFQAMQASFIVDIPGGLNPEYVIVIETVGKLDEFQRAIRYVPGLEWLVEIDKDEIEPDLNFHQECKISKHLISGKVSTINKTQSKQIWQLLKENDFIDEEGFLKDKNIEEFRQYLPAELLTNAQQIIDVIKNEYILNNAQKLSGRLYLTMSNKQAIDKLLNLWNQWDAADKKLPRNYGIWADIFKQIKTIRKWDITDRVRDTGVEDYWKEEIEVKRGTASNIAFEIELVYRTQQQKRETAETKLRSLIASEGGTVITTCNIDKIHYHAIKVELPVESIAKVISKEYEDIFLCDDVMYFRPTGQCKVETYEQGTEKQYVAGQVTGEPVVAILDGAPYVNHKLLENRIILDDPDDFESAYDSKEKKHGTAMASLVCHGELDSRESALPRPVYFRPILKPDPDDFVNIPAIEVVPKEYFMEDLLERAVIRMFEDGSGRPAIAPKIKIINLSVCDSSKMYFNQLSSCAKLLDWLSFKYQVLFCVSAGNINDDINLGVNESDLRLLSPSAIVTRTMKKIHDNYRNRKILSPADSINSITVGSIHSDKSTPEYVGTRIDILPNANLPSPLTAHGLGHKNSIKPELYIEGGRQLYNAAGPNYKISSSGFAPGQFVATTPVTGGETNRCVYVRGTSNSAAIATRGAAQIYEMLNILITENDVNVEDKNIAAIIKSLLVHSASWGQSGNDLDSIFRTDDQMRPTKKDIARYLGYGIPNIDRVLGCTSQRATAIGYGKIKKDEKHEYLFPLPPSLSGVNNVRRLIITLAWLSPVNVVSRKYRKAYLSIELPSDNIGTRRANADGQQVKNGTVQHEVYEGNNVVAFQDGDKLNISVVCREDADGLGEEIYYGFAVTLEVPESINLPIYEEIKERILIQVPIQAQV